MTPFGTLAEHAAVLRSALKTLENQAGTIECWGRHLCTGSAQGARLLVAGNGGSAAEAQHLTAELVGRFETGRRPLAAIALHADSSTLTAVTNDLGAEEMFARQVEAHGRSGDVLLLLSTSGRSPNLLRAAQVATGLGVQVWSLTGPWPNPLALASDDNVAIDVDSSCAVQEAHLVAVHALSAVVDRLLTTTAEADGTAGVVAPGTVAADTAAAVRGRRGRDPGRADVNGTRA